jgi:hypothetical protein
MIASVRKFSVSTEGPNGKLHQVLFIHEDKAGKLIYCAVGQDGEQLFIDAEKVTTVKMYD